jgi:hypothetical protein
LEQFGILILETVLGKVLGAAACDCFLPDWLSHYLLCAKFEKRGMFALCEELGKRNCEHILGCFSSIETP